MPATRTQRCGCGRGVFGLIDWTTPIRRPAVWAKQAPIIQSKTPEPSPSPIFSPLSPEYNGGSWADHADIAMPDNSFMEGQLLYVKYTYAANPDTPLGEPELDVSLKEKVTFINYHVENNHWAKVRNGAGSIGYIPSNYAVAIDEQVSALPWIKKQQVVEVPQQEAEFKPYKSAYAKEKAPESTDTERYYCEVCVKDFNGPQPYKMHLNSKNHKEEVENAAHYN